MLNQTTDLSGGSPALLRLRGAHRGLLRLQAQPTQTEQAKQQIGRFLQAGPRAGRLLSAAAERAEAQAMLRHWEAVAAQWGQHWVVALEPFAGADTEAVACPYVGLRVLSEGEQGLFVGRTAVRQLVDHLYQQRSLVVVGEPGSGKSSLVMAGLLPKLKEDAALGSHEWHYLPPFSPGSNPLATLVRTLGQDRIADEQWFWQQIRRFRQPSYLRQLLDGLSDKPTVLVIDQFEEIFTLCTNAQLRHHFVQNLATLMADATNPHVLILLMRSGFARHVATLGAFAEQFERARVEPAAMSQTALRNALEQPARNAGVHFEAGLAAQVTQDLAAQPNPLPLLQVAATQLWEARAHNQVGWAAYEQLGRAEMMLAQLAEQLYQSFGEQEREVMRRLLLRLVRFVDGGFVRQSVERGALRLVDETAVHSVLRRLLRAGLVVERAGQLVELTHDTLLHNWERLQRWLQHSRELLRQRRLLTEAAERWELSQRDDRHLWSLGAQFERARRWDDLSRVERAFLEAVQQKTAVSARQQPVTRPRPVVDSLVPAPARSRASSFAWASLLVAIAAVLVASLVLSTAYIAWQNIENQVATTVAEATGEANKFAVETTMQANRFQAAEEQFVVTRMWQGTAVARAEVEQIAAGATLTAVEAAQQAAEAAEQAALAAEQAALAGEQAAVARAQAAEVVRATAQAAIPIIHDDLNQISDRNSMYEQHRSAKRAFEAAQAANLPTEQAQSRMREMERQILQTHVGLVEAFGGQPRLDGRLDDWQAVGPTQTFYDADGVDFNAGQAAWRLSWNGTHLFVAVEVATSGAELYGVSLQIDRERTADYFAAAPGLNEDDLQITFVPKVDEPGFAIRRFRGNGEQRNVIDIEAYRQPTGAGYTLEAAIPWGNLTPNGRSPALNEQWGVALNLVARSGGETAVPTVIKSHVPGRTYDDPATWGVLVFR